MPLVVSIGVIGACCLLCVCARVPLLYRQLCAVCAVRGCRRVGGRSQVRGWRQLFQSRRRGPAGSLGRRASELLRRSGTAEQHGTDKGQLNEDVSGANIAVNGSAGITAPADVTPSATSYPVGVIYDADGSVIDSIFGATTSTPEACQQNGVFVWAVSGALFNGNHGNPVTGWTGSDGSLLTEWGSEDPSVQGERDLSGIRLPPGVTSANDRMTFESISPTDILENAVGHGERGRRTALRSVLRPALRPSVAVQDLPPAQESRLRRSDPAGGRRLGR